MSETKQWVLMERTWNTAIAVPLEVFTAMAGDIKLINLDSKSVVTTTDGDLGIKFSLISNDTMKTMEVRGKIQPEE